MRVCQFRHFGNGTDAKRNVANQKAFLFYRLKHTCQIAWPLNLVVVGSVELRFVVLCCRTLRARTT